jgi:uncharacterized protein
MKAVLTEMGKGTTVEEIIDRLKTSFSEEELVFCYKWIGKWDRLIKRQGLGDHKKSGYNPALSAEKIRGFLLRNGLLQLILGVTEDCNFRCKYCMNSDCYRLARGYRQRHMSFAVAKKAID